MTQTVKTLVFLGVAVASVVVAAGTYYSRQPADITDFTDVGTQFYPDFEDPAIATGLQVAAYNPENGKTDLFKVEVKDGKWRIPSHHDYPADGKDQLSKIAAAVLGVSRQALVERSKDAQKRYGLLDPLNTDTGGTEGRGTRITLFKGTEVLVDYIVGKQVEKFPGMFYVRRADEDRFYTADLGNLKVSTKFADWIEKDLLELQPSDVNELIINRYSVDESEGRIIQDETIDITRSAESQQWVLEGLNPETEQVIAKEIDGVLRSINDLQIVGVRKKPEALSDGLKSEDGTLSIDPLTQQDMRRKGVYISKRGEFIYNEGKVNVGTSSGIYYELGFGQEFSGTAVDIEIGETKSPEEEAKELIAEAEGEKPAVPLQDKNRYLFISAYFSKSLLGPEPQAPVAPVQPEVAPLADDATEEQKAAAAEKAYQEALQDFELRKEVFETQKLEYQNKVTVGQKRANELNARFADWYYVIPEQLFVQLKLKREDLVEEVPQAEMPSDNEPAPAKGGLPEVISEQRMEKEAEAAEPAATPLTTEPEKTEPAIAPEAEPAPEMKEPEATPTPEVPANSDTPPDATPEPATPAEETPTEETPAAE
ncbi:DUF4340 domain-containing protein [Planctomicrobium sp. SH668]|uniref:DUF4340 domain-containing protein n=1 Tax=Planctomicrobium sp. SH668 TaxID=3448126 RepID=UPI003F5B146D